MQDELFLLIKSMTKAEKRYFSVQSSTFGKEAPNYLRLFQAMQQQDVYDEGAIKKTFAKEAFIKQLSTIRNTLMNKLLLSLSSYHANSSIPRQLRESLDHLDVLWAKRIYKALVKLLKRAKKLAADYEEFALLYFFIQKERKFLLAQKAKKIEQEIERLAKEENTVLQKISLESQFKQVETSVYVHLKIKLGEQDHKLEASWQKINQHPLLQSAEEACTFRSRCCYHDIKGYFFTRKKEFQQAHFHYKKVVDCWEEQPHFKQAYKADYLKALCNFMNGCYIAKDLENYRLTLEKLQASPSALVNLDPKEIQTICYHEILYFLSNKKIDQGLKELPRILEMIKGASSQIHSSRIIVMYYNCAVLAFLADDLELATDALQAVIALPKVDARLDVLRFSRLFLSILYYELDLWDLANTYFRSAYRGISSPSDFEAVLLSWLRKMLKQKTSNQKEKRVFYGAFLTNIQALPSSSQQTIGFEEIGLWLRSKLTGQAVKDLY